MFSGKVKIFAHMCYFNISISKRTLVVIRKCMQRYLAALDSLCTSTFIMASTAMPACIMSQTFYEEIVSNDVIILKVKLFHVILPLCSLIKACVCRFAR